MAKPKPQTEVSELSGQDSSAEDVQAFGMPGPEPVQEECKAGTHWDADLRMCVPDTTS